MKLHLPVTLLRAVMTLFVSHCSLTTSWAEDATQQYPTTTYDLDADVTYTYGYNGEPWAGKIPEWGWENGSYVLKDGVNLIFTYSPPTPTPTPPSLVFNGSNGAFNGDSNEAGYAAVVGNIVTIENLNNVQFTGFDGNSYAVYTPELTIQNNTKVSVDNNTGDTNIYSGIVTLSGNGSIVMSQNAVESPMVRREDGVIVNTSVRGGVIYVSSTPGNDNHCVSVLGNGTVEFSGNQIVADCWEAYGGVIYTDGQVSLKENTKVSFNGNHAESNFVDKYDESYDTSTRHSYAYGGAIYSDYFMYEQDRDDEGNLKWEDAYDSNGKLIYDSEDNVMQRPVYREKDDPYGVSICGNKGSENNPAVEFKDNTVVGSMGASGGAIYNDTSKTLLSDNGSLTFMQNKVEAKRDGTVCGGAIYSGSSLTITGNGDILFDENTISTVGGRAFGSVIAVEEGSVFIDENKGTLTVSNNGVTTYGEFYGKDGNLYKGNDLAFGAITSMTTLSLSSNNGKIEFSDNYIKDLAGTAENYFDFNGRQTASEGGVAAGAAIAVAGPVVVNENKSDILFSGNTITSQCKSVFGSAIVNIMGDIAFRSNEGKIEFTGNTASTTAQGYAWGGAIATCATLASILAPEITAESSVVFDGNKDISFSGNSVSALYGIALGGAIYSSNDVTFVNNGNISFGGVIQEGDAVVAQTAETDSIVGNTVHGYQAKGGAIYSEGNVIIGSVENDQSLGNGNVTFVGNSVIAGGGDAFGGAVYSSGVVDIKGNESGVNFSGNSITCVGYGDGFGGAIYAGQNSGNDYNPDNFGHHVALSNNGNVTFESNTIDSEFRARGGAIYADGVITLDSNKDVKFSGNTVSSANFGSAVGGAISTYLLKSQDSGHGAVEEVNVKLVNNEGDITFSGNKALADAASAHGGAIYSANSVEITSNGGDILFSENENSATVVNGLDKDCSATGGAISAVNAVIISKNNENNKGEVKFTDNKNIVQGGHAGGGAIYACHGGVSISENKAVVFSGNTVEGVGAYVDGGVEKLIPTTVAGGAIASDNSFVSITGNGDVTIEGNKLLDKTIAITSDTENDWESDGSLDLSSCVSGGGAVMSLKDIDISKNADVSISGNTAHSDSRMVLGGALASSGKVSISDNTGNVNISGNGVSSTKGTAIGGAIYAVGGLSIVNNGDVTFQGNYTKNGGTYQLNSVYVVDGGNVELSAAEGKSISFYDSIHVGEGSEVKLNSYSYTDAEGKTHTSTGSIVFSGATTEDDLKTAKDGLAGTDAEIAASRTSVIDRNVSVAAGSLEVVDEAIVKMNSLEIMSGAELVVGSGSAVEAEAVSIKEGATLSVTATAKGGTYSLNEAARAASAESESGAALAASTLVLNDGVTFTTEGGAYLNLKEVDMLDMSNVKTMNFEFGDKATTRIGDKVYYVFFTGYKGLEESIVNGNWYTHNLDDRNMQGVAMGYHAETGTLYFSATAPIPEPTTATLSLLALAGLAARRRRK